MKKVFYVMLTLLLATTVSMNAQVRIGNTTDPHAGAVLDLKSTETTEKGVLFPNVKLLDVEVFQLAGDKTQGEGMVIYNTNEAIGKGVYCWNGERWNKVNGVSENPADLILTGTPADWVSVDPSPNAGDGTQENPYVNTCPGTTVVLSPQSGYTFGTVTPESAASLADGSLTFTASGSVLVKKGTQSGWVYVDVQSCVVVPVTGVTVSPTTAPLIVANQQILLTATVAPDNATNKAVTWTSSDANIATVEDNGLVIAKKNGIVSITATTIDGNETASSTIIVHIGGVISRDYLLASSTTIISVNDLVAGKVGNRCPAGFRLPASRQEAQICGGVEPSSTKITWVGAEKKSESTIVSHCYSSSGDYYTVSWYESTGNSAPYLISDIEKIDCVTDKYTGDNYDKWYYTNCTFRCIRNLQD